VAIDIWRSTSEPFYIRTYAYLMMGDTTPGGLPDLTGRPLAAGDCALDRSVVATDVGRFAGEEKRSTDRLTQRLVGFLFPDFSVAIRAARERIRLPVVKVCVL